ncbi:MAG: bifunctional UDP-N-acetylmuramoyl-tripeptide:D-alanyl-D-alanine ligase/alanine racemase [Bacteroidota bacterium]
MSYTIQHIQTIFQAENLNEEIHSAHIQYLLTDTRKLTLPEKTLFFAFQGARQDGHDFIAQAYQKGVRHFVVTNIIDSTEFPKANFLLVKDAHQAIHALVQYHRAQFALPVISITGSNGKTIIKEWLFQLLQSDYRVVRSPRSYNSQLGVPLSVWQLNGTHEIAIFEAGISEMGEMEKLQPVIQPTIGIFTNIGTAHDAGFPDRRTKVEEKMRLFEEVEVLIYRKDELLIDETAQRLKGVRFLTWSYREEGDLIVQTLEKKEGGTLLTATYQSETLQMSVPFYDRASIENAVHCWLLLLHLDIKDDQIEERMRRLSPVNMRLESRRGIHNSLIINDSYNSDLTSLSMALDFLQQQSTRDRHVLILSDILQSGMSNQQLYGEVAQLIGAHRIQQFIGIGEHIQIMKTMLPKSIDHSFYSDTSTFLAQLDTTQFQSASILIKGARPFQFERIAHRLSERIHQTTLEVNVAAILHNLNVFSSYLKPTTKVMMMVKAAAYGSGSLEIARLLEFQNIDYLAVAYADEGVELRRGGIQLPIMVLNPEVHTFDLCVEYNLEPEIYSLSLLRELIRYLPDQKSISIHLELESGMQRLGFEEQTIDELVRELLEEPRIRVASIFSHLVASEADEHDAFTQQQINTYYEHYERIAERIGYRPLRHILNTSGIIRFPNHQMDMVRLGIGLYGLDNGSELTDQLQVVNTLKTRISQIKTIPKDATVGYGRAGRVERDSRIATVSIGYADGLPRSVGNGQFSFHIHGQFAPILGNVCMDMCMVDVTDILQARAGDEVVVFGDSPSIQELAVAAGTIPLELFTGIGERVKRVYVQE